MRLNQDEPKSDEKTLRAAKKRRGEKSRTGKRITLEAGNQEE